MMCQSLRSSSATQSQLRQWSRPPCTSTQRRRLGVAPVDVVQAQALREIDARGGAGGGDGHGGFGTRCGCAARNLASRAPRWKRRRSGRRRRRSRSRTASAKASASGVTGWREPARCRPRGPPRAHTILPRMLPMSLLEKARSVWVLTLPSLATESENAVMVSSSGASNTATTS